MRLHNAEPQWLRFSLAAAVIIVLAWAGASFGARGPGYAAPPAIPDTSHRTPTATPTPGEVVLASTEKFEAGIDPFLGIEASPTFLLIHNFCDNAIVSEDGEAWVVSTTSFTIGDPGQLSEPALYVQRCVGSFQEWSPAEAAISPELFRPVLPELSMAEIPPTPTPASSIARALIPREAILEALITPIAVDRPPILAPIFSTPIPVIVPTLAAPQIYEQLPQTTVTLLTPGGETLVLDNYPGRPDLWTYEFPVTSEGGNYTLTIESQDEKQVRAIDVQGEARIFTTNLTGVLQEEFDVPADVIVNYVDFMQGREVAVNLYRVVEAPQQDVFSQDALAQVDGWTFTPAQQPAQERLAQRLDPMQGPPFGTFIFLACYVDECNQLPRVQVQSRQVSWPHVVLGSVWIEPNADVLTLPDTFQPIRFSAGATEATIGLTLSDTGVEGYVLNVAQDQQLVLALDSPNVQPYVLDPNNQILLPSATEAGAWQFDIPQTGQYAIVLYGNEDAHLTVVIPALGTSPSPPPAVVILRPACGNTANVEAGVPLELRYGIWANRGLERAAQNQQSIQIELTVDGRLIQGRRMLPPVATLEPGICGQDYQDSYWIYHVAELAGLSPGEHDARVTFRFAQPVEDGYGSVYTEPFDQQFTIIAE